MRKSGGLAILAAFAASAEARLANQGELELRSWHIERVGVSFGSPHEVSESTQHISGKGGVKCINDMPPKQSVLFETALLTSNRKSFGSEMAKKQPEVLQRVIGYIFTVVPLTDLSKRYSCVKKGEIGGNISLRQSGGDTCELVELGDDGEHALSPLHRLKLESPLSEAVVIVQRFSEASEVWPVLWTPDSSRSAPMGELLIRLQRDALAKIEKVIYKITRKTPELLLRTFEMHLDHRLHVPNKTPLKFPELMRLIRRVIERAAAQRKNPSNDGSAFDKLKSRLREAIAAPLADAWRALEREDDSTEEQNPTFEQKARELETLSCIEDLLEAHENAKSFGDNKDANHCFETRDPFGTVVSGAVLSTKEAEAQLNSTEDVVARGILEALLDYVEPAWRLPASVKTEYRGVVFLSPSSTPINSDAALEDLFRLYVERDSPNEIARRCAAAARQRIHHPKLNAANDNNQESPRRCAAADNQDSQIAARCAAAAERRIQNPELNAVNDNNQDSPKEIAARCAAAAEKRQLEAVKPAPVKRTWPQALGDALSYVPKLVWASVKPSSKESSLTSNQSLATAATSLTSNQSFATAVTSLTSNQSFATAYGSDSFRATDQNAEAGQPQIVMSHRLRREKVSPKKGKRKTKARGKDGRGVGRRRMKKLAASSNKATNQKKPKRTATATKKR